MSIEDRVWIKVPATGIGTDADPVRAKTQVEGTAFLVHHEGNVYITFRDDVDYARTIRQSDCYQLTREEGRAFEETLTFPLPDRLFPDRANVQRVGLGDVVAWVARTIGITECGQCQQRRRKLNRIIVWGWWKQ
jgi:hypothetical protein